MVRPGSAAEGRAGGGNAWDTGRPWQARRGGGPRGGDWAGEGALCAVLQLFRARGRGTEQGGPLSGSTHAASQRPVFFRKDSLETFGKTEGFFSTSLFAAWSQRAASALGCRRLAAGLASSRGPPGFPSAPLRGSPCAPCSRFGIGLPTSYWFRKGVRAPPSGLGSHFAFCSCWTKPNTVADGSGDSWHCPWRSGLKRLLDFCRSVQRIWT
uniref:uncharacterized protein LOC108591652 isoform X2 n=1 Tax=Callithrix jacchus TaxID=9483 RepID=UPI0023DD1F3A|nr:uncharacterized protein LOC108591652 isoform X2 [Callithrix jacchus]